jgi:uncharacterized membrane protein YfcA
MPLELLLILIGVGTGIFGALLGLGGGILIVPILTLGLDIPLRTAIGTSLIAVIATSTGAAALNVRAGRADIRLGITLAAGTVVGALTGGVLAGFLPERFLAALFALLLVYTAFTMGRGLLAGRSRPAEARGDSASEAGEAPDYRTHRLPAAIGGSFGAGNLSGLLGVGGGIVVVPLMHLVMRAPMRTAVATSNFMIGMTAAAGAYAYLFRGDVDPRIAGPVVLGVAAGGVIGALSAARLRPSWLIALFVVVVAYVAFQMGMRAISG